MEFFIWLLILLVAAVALTAIARRLNLPYLSLIALGGTALAFIPNAPEFELDPQLTLALFVAPVLLDAAYDTSLRDLKRMWVPVLSLVVIAVGITTIAVAWLVHRMMPGIPWAAAIALGAIVAPPDAAAASAVLRRLNLPHRMLVILGGESLLNDATALLVYRIVVGAAMGSAFTTGSLAPQALAMFGSVVAGFILGWIGMRIMRAVTDVPSAIILQFVSTFGVWILADEAGLSAIITLVTYAITISRLGSGTQSARMRLPSYAVWETVVFVMNVLAFVLIGLQLRPILGNLEADVQTRYLQVAAAVLGMVVFVRFAWVMTYNRVAYFKFKWLGPGSWPGPTLPSLGASTVVSWCGMRGIVTLAAAYALPLHFPYRDLILLCAFGVVVGTLIVQGLTLRPLILAMHLRTDSTVDDEIRVAKARLAKVANEILDGDGTEVAEILRDEFSTPVADGDGVTPESGRVVRNRLRARIVTAQREVLVQMRASAEIGDDAFHRIEERLDWAEVNVR
ncbi:MAG: sodium:proton antiporter [Pseudomonadota bacterium]